MQEFSFGPDVAERAVVASRDALSAFVPEAAPERALVLSGGIALGAFEAGAFAAIEQSGEPVPSWIAAASSGAVNAAIIAGNPPGERAAALRRFWDGVASDPTPGITAVLGPPPHSGSWRRAYNDTAVLQSLVFGRRGLFRHRSMPGPRAGAVPGVYDLAPLIARLREVADFDRLNTVGPRVSIVATDVVSGERVVFDTARGTRIGPEHVAASGALAPLFAAVELDGRLLGDGGLASNTPIDLVLDEPGETPLVCLAVELFARRGLRPRSFGAMLERATDVGFGSQTLRMLEGRAREHRLLALVSRLRAQMAPDAAICAEIDGVLMQAREKTVVTLCYCPAVDEAGPGKLFDFSSATIEERWTAGETGMRKALRRLRRPDKATMLAPGLLLHELEVGLAAFDTNVTNAT